MYCVEINVFQPNIINITELVYQFNLTFLIIKLEKIRQRKKHSKRNN